MSSEENTEQNSFNQEEVLNESNIQSNEIKSDENPTFTTDSQLSTNANNTSDELESKKINPLTATEVETTSSLSNGATNTLEENEPDDILGNKSILKQTITPGVSDTRPTRNSLVIVSYQLFLVDNTTLNSRLIETIKNESFFVGEYDTLSAIDISIQLMDRGEHAIIDSDPRHCYGTNGCEEKGIPPISDDNSYRMKIDIELNDWKSAPNIETLTVDERFHWSDKKRQRGNILYRRKEYTSALQCYQHALKFVDINENPLVENEENNQSSVLIDRYIQIQNNLAQVYLLNNKYEECLNSVDNVLKYDSNNIKAMFRQAKALIELGNYDHALQRLKLLSQNPNKDVEKDKIREMINFCETKLAKYHKNEKEIYRRMFQSKSTPTNEQTQLKEPKKKTTKNNNWLAYAAIGSVALAAVGIAAVLKYA